MVLLGSKCIYPRVCRNALDVTTGAANGSHYPIDRYLKCPGLQWSAEGVRAGAVGTGGLSRNDRAKEGKTCATINSYQLPYGTAIFLASLD
jgi:hypothetical protein